MSDPVVVGLRAEAGEVRERAWRALYDAHFDRVYRLCCRFGVRDGDVEDVTQRIFLVAHERLREVDSVGDVGAWIRGIGVRVISDYHRWWRVRAVKTWLVKSTAEAQAHRAVSPDDDASARQTRAHVAEVLARMSDKLRQTLVLLEIEQCTPSEVADIVGIPVNTVRSRARLGREQFHRIWQERYGRGESRGQ